MEGTRRNEEADATKKRQRKREFIANGRSKVTVKLINQYSVNCI